MNFLSSIDNPILYIVIVLTINTIAVVINNLKKLSSKKVDTQ